MLRFSKIDIPCTQIISKAVASTGWASCQLSAVSLFCYAEKYNTEACLSNGFAFIKQKRPDTCYFLPIPLCENTYSRAELDEAIKELLGYHGKCVSGNFVIWGIADDMLKYSEVALKNNGLTKLKPDRNWAEYIHLSENLINMKGKRFHAKRNSVNQFIRDNGAYCYAPLDKSITDEVADFQTRLLNNARNSNASRRSVSELEAENIAILRGLEYFEALRLHGGVIRVNGSICAFGFGGMINHDTFDLAFEKASKNYNGIHQVLEQELFKNNPAIRYVNREEDLGIEGLRFAKERLRPDSLLLKRSFTV